MGATPRHDRTALALLEAAATVFAEEGLGAGLAEVADAAGVGRATLYRYYPNREALLAALIGYALDETSARLEAADLPNVAFGEGLARVCRALVAAQSKYAVLAQLLEHGEREQLKARIGDPIRELLRRGAQEGLLRPDLAEPELLAVLGSLIEMAAQMAAQGKAGIERAASIARSVFMDGATLRQADHAATLEVR